METKAAHNSSLPPIAVHALALGCLALGACSTAASAGDDALRLASLGRIQATPFTDRVDAQDCRTALVATYGFVRESRAMKNDVFVVQSFDCKAARVVASVSLKNYSSNPMHCFAETEDGVYGVTVAPNAAGYFEYSYAAQAYQNCQGAG